MYQLCVEITLAFDHLAVNAYSLRYCKVRREITECAAKRTECAAKRSSDQLLERTSTAHRRPRIFHLHVFKFGGFTNSLVVDLQ